MFYFVHGAEGGTQLRLEGNPLHALPSEVFMGKRELNASAVLDYLRALAKGDVPWKLAKVVLVGEEGAGKTSLLRALKPRRLPPLLKNDDPVSTNGVFVTEFATKEVPHDLQLIAYDFGTLCCLDDIYFCPLRCYCLFPL